MTKGHSWESLDVHLLRVLQVLLSECNVSRAARRLRMSQPAVSTALKRLRDITGDKLLVRSRDGMTPTERGAALLEPVTLALAQLERIGNGSIEQPCFSPQGMTRCFNVATPDYLDAVLLGDVIAAVHRDATHSQVMFHSMSAASDYPRALENGDLDVVIGNWPYPPEHLRTRPLFDDRMVVMMRKDHPLAHEAQLDAERWLAAEHLAPTPYAVGQRGVVDVFLARERLRRKVVAYVPYFHMAPYLLLHSDLIFTAPARFAEHYGRFLPLAIRAAPDELPGMSYFLLWHDRTHDSLECRWFRERLVDIVRGGAAAR